MTADHVFAGIPVADYPAARAWYVGDLGRWAAEADESLPGMRRVEVSDPDGNRIQLAQPLS